MTFARLLATEFLKLKSSFIKPVAALTPLIAGALTFVNFYVRRDYYQELAAKEGLSAWETLIFQHHFLWYLFLGLVVMVFAFQVLHVEYKSNSWKQALTLPVSRAKIYAAKWCAVFILSTAMIAANGILLGIMGKLLGFAEPLPVSLLLTYTGYQIAAISSLISCQGMLSALVRHPGISLTIGAAGVASSLFLAQSEAVAKFVPYAHIVFAVPDPAVNNAFAAQYGLGFGLGLLLAGMLGFNVKEIY